MRSLLFVLVAALCALSPTSSSWASLPDGAHPSGNEPCIPDCPNDNFQGPFYHIATISCGGAWCPVEIEYWKREACPIDGVATYYDFQITSVHFAIMGSQCWGCSLEMTMKGAVDALIVDNPMNFPPTAPNDCRTNWRVSAAACWKWTNSDGNPNPPYDMISPCSGAACCFQRFQVCTDANGNRLPATPINVGTPPVVCELGPNCVASCSFLNPYDSGEPDPPHGKPARTRSSAGTAVKALAEVVVVPNPAASVVNLNLDVAGPGVLFIAFTDANGSTRLTVRHDADAAGKVTVPVSVGRLSSGAYLISVEHDGQRTAKGNLVIAR